jgi:CHAD domain
MEVDGRTGPATMRPMKERTTNVPLLSRRFQLVLLHLAEEARRDLDSPGTRRMRAIHSLRTRMKNLRALLLLVKSRIPKPTRKAVATLAGALKDAFSVQRDTHVVATLRSKFPGLHDSKAKENETLNEQELDKAAKAKASRLVRMVSKLTLAGLTWADVIGGYLRTCRAGRKAMKVCEKEPAEKSFHDWRRPVKDLFYQSQVLQPLDGMKHRRNAADRLSSRLGDMNDLHLLRHATKKSSSSAALKRIAKAQREVKPAIFKAAAKLFSLRPAEIGRSLERCVKFQPAITAQAVRQA